MSAETLQWLSQNTLIGFTDKRGQAWHHRQGHSNSYPGAVPLERVESLFDFTVDPQTIYVMDPAAPLGFAEVPNRQAWVSSRTAEVLGIFTNGYKGHQYSQWLVENVAMILHGGLAVGSAGLLRGGRQAWVSVEVPENFTTPEGVAFRPNLMAATSFDGSLATTYKRVVTNVVCDNTMAAALRESGQQFKVRHSANSLTKIGEARDALALIEQDSETFAAEVAALTAVTITRPQWIKIRNEILAPMPERGKTGRGQTMATTKRDELERLWTQDLRVAPWSGTAFGVLQADNTYRQHVQSVKGAERTERNMINAIEGTTVNADRDTMSRVLELVGK
jgi:phage/plasmid-like protein (TIGR03299 family)